MQILDANLQPYPPVDNAAVARRLVSLRSLQDLTQEQLAEKAGVAPSTVWRAEQRGVYSIVTLVALNKVFKTSMDYILYGTGAP